MGTAISWRFPGGRLKAVTLSYDDGRTHDRRLVNIFNRHGLRGTFHLNSGMLGRPGYIEAGEVAELFRGHEIAAHTVSHPHLTQVPRETALAEVLEDRRALEALAGYPVRGFSYPFGDANAWTADVLRSCGIAYGRTTVCHGGFGLPEDPWRWAATCHHKNGLMDKAAALVAWRHQRCALLYVWGHSYEFENDSNWDVVETFASTVGAAEDVWKATNIQVIDYVEALRRLAVSVDGALVSNPSACSVWVSVGGRGVEIPAGGTVTLA